MEFDRKVHANLFKKALSEDKIKKSQETFKIKLFFQKAENSLLIAKHLKEINPSKDQPKKIHWNYWAITVSYYSMLYAAKAAILHKGYESEDHEAVQIAIGHLLVPNELEKKDLEILNQSYKIFEDEYVHYFEDARKESHTARYSAVKTYTERRLDEIFDNATKFIAKIGFILENYLK